MVVHLPVLLQETIDGLQAKKGDIVLDATVGGGGHSEALCRAMGGGTFICLDVDEDAIERSRERLKKCGCEFLFYRTNFRDLDMALDSLGIGTVHRALFDLGMSSFQLEESGRGFSFQRVEPLLMTMQSNSAPDALTAARIVNEWDAENIETILRSYGDERAAKRIAQRIVAARAEQPIQTSRELAGLIEQAAPRKGRIHPATKTFQALRIAVNDDFRALQEGLPKAWDRLEKGGRMAVISFQSMEDRLVKRFLKGKASAREGTLIAKKSIVPTAAEVQANPRARSAKLRIIEKIK